MRATSATISTTANTPAAKSKKLISQRKVQRKNPSEFLIYIFLPIKSEEVNKIDQSIENPYRY
jgi:hypothetical protein